MDFKFYHRGVKHMEFGIANEAFKLILNDSGIEAAKLALKQKSFRAVAARGDWVAFQLIFFANENFSVNPSDMPCHPAVRLSVPEHPLCHQQPVQHHQVLQ